MDRIIEVKVNGGYLSADSRKAGNQHEANITKLRITFDPSWDGYAKTVTFWNALRANPVKRTLTADLLDNLAASTRVYLCPIPGEAMTESGMMSFVIDGYLDGVRQRSVGVELEVEESPYEDSAGEPADPTPSQAEQLQGQIETLLPVIREDKLAAMDAASQAAGSAAQAEQSATAAAQSAQSVWYSEHNTNVYMQEAKICADAAELSRYMADVSREAAQGSADAASRSEANAKYYASTAKEVAGGDFVTPSEVRVVVYEAMDEVNASDIDCGTF